jgi:hypothetical protein
MHVLDGDATQCQRSNLQLARHFDIIIYTKEDSGCHHNNVWKLVIH